MTTSSTSLLIDLIGRKHDCLVALRDLGLRQRELIDAGDMTQLLGVLAEKQRTIVQLQTLEQDLNPFRADDPERRAWSSEAERVRCASLAERSARLLAEILESEKRSEDVLRRRRDDTAEQLAAAQVSGTARGAYAEADRYQPSSLDLSTEY
ncbi:MAG: flagellar protein FlgN [Planctomycetia bacterium]|nr:flagellar protein FlgN [Planctomycetia bacterium]